MQEIAQHCACTIRKCETNYRLKTLRHKINLQIYLCRQANDTKVVDQVVVWICDPVVVAGTS